jgi:hypothetical protein
MTGRKVAARHEIEEATCMPSLDSSSELRGAAARPHVHALLSEPRKQKNARKAGVLECLLVMACAGLLAQLFLSGLLNLKTWPGSLAGLMGLAATGVLIIARFDVSFIRLFRPRRRDEVEFSPLPWWLSQSLTVVIVVLVAGIGMVLFGMAGLSISGIAATVVSLPSWVWIVANVLLVAAALAWRAASKR